MKKTNPKILVFGTGGHTKSVIKIIEDEAKWDIHGLLGDSEYLKEKDDIEILGHKIVGYRNDISHLLQANIMNGFVAIGDNHLRAKIMNELISKGMKMSTIIHPDASVLNNSPLGHGTMIHTKSVVGEDATIGKGVIISALAVVGHDSCIGDYAHITPGVLLGGGVTIGDFSFLGLGAVVLPDVKIGKNVQVGANSLVNKDIGDNVIVVGTPARVIRRTTPL